MDHEKCNWVLIWKNWFNINVVPLVNVLFDWVKSVKILQLKYAAPG